MAIIAKPHQALNDLCDMLGLSKEARVRGIDLRIVAKMDDAVRIRAEVEMIMTDEQMAQLGKIVRDAKVEVETRTIDPRGDLGWIDSQRERFRAIAKLQSGIDHDVIDAMTDSKLNEIIQNEQRKEMRLPHIKYGANGKAAGTRAYWVATWSDPNPKVPDVPMLENRSVGIDFANSASFTATWPEFLVKNTAGDVIGQGAVATGIGMMSDIDLSDLPTIVEKPA